MTGESRSTGLPWKLALLVLVGISLCYAVTHRWWEQLEMKWFDAALKARSAMGWVKPLDGRVHIVEVRTEELNEIRLTGEYAAIAQSIRQLVDLGASVIVLDALFVRGGDEEKGALRSAIDAALGEGRRVVLPAFSVREGAPHAELLRPLYAEAKTNLSFGLVNAPVDPDGTWRHYEFAGLADAERRTPSLALAALLALREEQMELKRDAKGRGFDLLHYEDPTRADLWLRLPDEPLLVNYREPYASDALDRKAGLSRRFWTLKSIEALHQGRAQAASAAAGGSALSGTVAILCYEEGDEKSTPMGAREPGGLIHATALSDLLQRSVLRRAPWQMDVAIVVVASVMVLGCFRLSRKRALAAGTLVLLAALLAGYALTLVREGQVVAFIAPATVMALLFTGELAHRHSLEHDARLRLDTIMRYYFAPRVLEQVKANPGSMQPKEADLVLLLTDVRNFSTLCERLSAQEMFALLNNVFEVETQAVLDRDGSLEHFLGDQFLAYWGAPYDQPQGADLAISAATSLITALEALRARFTGAAAELFDYGVGLHAGRGLVGNKGSTKFLDYGLLGDVVNTAARVESLTKVYGVKLLATDAFLSRLSARPPHRVLDVVQVKGREAPVTLVEIASPVSQARFEELAQAYAIAFAQYQKGQFFEAATAFTGLAKEHGDKASGLLAGRCEVMSKNPPDKWAGIYKFMEK